jgi:hypothetical protein
LEAEAQVVGMAAAEAACEETVYTKEK